MSLGWPELLVILTIIVIIFGAGKLPEVGGAVGKGIKEFGAAAREKKGNDQEPETLQGDSREKPAQP